MNTFSLILLWVITLNHLIISQYLNFEMFLIPFWNDYVLLLDCLSDAQWSKSHVMRSGDCGGCRFLMTTFFTIYFVLNYGSCKSIVWWSFQVSLYFSLKTWSRNYITAYLMQHMSESWHCDTHWSSFWQHLYCEIRVWLSDLQFMEGTRIMIWPNL